MRLIRLVLLGGLLIGACRGNGPLASCRAPPDPDARAAHEEQALDQMRPFERVSLEPFRGEAALHQYLDAVAGVEQYLAEAGSQDGALRLPDPPLSRMRAPGAQRDPRQIASALRDYGPAHTERPPRMVRRGDDVYVLFANELRGFAWTPGTGTLRERGRLRVAPPLLPVADAGVGSPSVEAAHTLEASVHFDYLFAREHELVLVGQRYDQRALQIIRVGIDAQGELSRSSSQLIRYLPPEIDGYRASLQDGALLLYLPHQLFFSESGKWGSPYLYSLPALGADGTPSWRALLGATQVVRPLAHTHKTVLHTLVRCELGAPDAPCQASAFPGPPAAALHLGRDALYLWLVAWSTEPRPERASFLLRMPVNGSPPGAVRVRGAPPSGGGHELHIDAGALHAIGAGERRDALRLLRVPLASFQREGPQLAASAYRTLMGPHEGAFDSERASFAGHYLLWGTKGVGSRSLPPTPFLDVVPLQGGPITQVEIGHSVTDLVELGEQVLAIGSDSWHLHYSLIGLGEQPPRRVGHYVLRDAEAKLEGFGSALALSAGTERWLAAAIAPRGSHDAETRLTLHWSPEPDALEAGDTWSVAKAEHSRLDPADSEVLLLDPSFSLLRIQAELRVYRADHESLTLTQSIALTP